MKILAPSEELAFLKSIAGDPEKERIIDVLKEGFNTLSTRSQVLLSLTTICLTITGFLGPKLAQANIISKIFIIIGLAFVTMSTLYLFTGPLFIQWMTREKSDTFDKTITKLIERRNLRTRNYRTALRLLAIGLSGYVVSVTAYLIEV